MLPKTLYSAQRSVTRTVVVAGLLAIATATAEAQLPTVQQVFDKFATAVGGRDAWASATSRTEKGTVDLAFAGVSGSYIRYSGPPNKFRMLMDLGVATIDQGSDGTIVWVVQPGAGGKMPPEETAYVLESSPTGSAFLDPTRFAKATVLAEETFDGVPCYKVSIVAKMGRERFDYFDVATGLRRGQFTQTPNGSQTIFARNYKSFDGKLVATSIVQQTAQGDVIIMLTSVEFGPVDPSKFVAPEGIK